MPHGPVEIVECGYGLRLYHRLLVVLAGESLDGVQRCPPRQHEVFHLVVFLIFQEIGAEEAGDGLQLRHEFVAPAENQAARGIELKNLAAVADAAVGTLTQDRATGIFGTLGQPPKMIPVKVAVSTSRGRNEEIRFESAIDDFLAPLVVNVGALNAISAQERGSGDTTITLTGTINVRGEEPIRVERRFTGNQAPPLSAAASAVPLALLLKSNLAGIDVTGVDLKFSVVEGSKAGALERVAVDRTQVRAGESLNVDMYIRTDGGKLETRSATVRIPENTPTGPLSLMIGDYVDSVAPVCKRG